MWGQLVLHCKIVVPAGGAVTCSLQQQLPAAKLIVQLVADSQQVLPSDSIFGLSVTATSTALQYRSCLYQQVIVGRTPRLVRVGAVRCEHAVTCCRLCGCAARSGV